MKDTFWSLLKQSVIVQATVTLILTCALVYMLITGMDVPELLTGVTMLVYGFWFGSKAQQQVDKAGG